MKVGILGSGMVGKELGKGFIKIGYQVLIGSRDTLKLQEWKDSNGKNASTGTFSDAALFGDIVVIATNWQGTENAIKMAGLEHFRNKIVIDVTNPLKIEPGAPPSFMSSVDHSGGGTIQGWLPGAYVVKAFNIISASTMCNPKMKEGTADLFIAGNNKESKELVAGIAKQWGWEKVIDLGDISNAFFLEALAMIWINYAFKNNKWNHAFKLLLN
ncbi:MAG: NAD(P)-binding domain-containing protein [Bacteroidota bacterium]|nr:NAD(P)-binding domain-containing protein [Bacteroidota bacterium]